jgi:hypothetical protein
MNKNPRSLAEAALCGLFLTIHGAPAQDWLPTCAPNAGWQAVASSADGAKLAAAAYNTAIYTSTNSGADWTATSAPSANWYSVASSADGSKLLAGGFSLLCTSTNSGATWTTNNSPSGPTFVACSGEGARMAAADASGHLYTSTNSGATWRTNLGLGAGNFVYSLASSADGVKLVAGADWFYTSTNAGATWTARWPGSASGDNYCAVATSSADGTRLLAAHEFLYTSTNSGAAWTTTGAPSAGWASVACSTDGTRLVAVIHGGGIYTSINSGVTWTSNTAPRTAWFSVASSADGSKLIATDAGPGISGGGIYTWQAAPVLGIALCGTNLVLSWPALSATAGFAPQQNSNLATTDWLPVKATVMATNGQNQATLPLPADNTFYCLRKL